MVGSNSSLPGCDNFFFYDVAASQSRDFYGWLFDKGLALGMHAGWEPDFMK